MKWARIENDQVVEIVLYNPKGRFHPSIVWVECPDVVVENWVYSNGEFSQPPVFPEPVPANISFRQLVLGLKRGGFISREEALAWSRREALPATVQAVIANMPAEQGEEAEITALTMIEAQRSDPLLAAAAQAHMPELTSAELEDLLDQSFRDWSKL